MTVAIRVKPGSSIEAVGGSYAGPYGDALVVAVHAQAVEGKANAAVVRAVAEALGIAKSTITVKFGFAARNKVLSIEAPPPDLAARLARLARHSQER